MAFVREIKKGGKIYRYKYESKRVNGKVKSIYLGKEIVKDSSSGSTKKKTRKIIRKSPSTIHKKTNPNSVKSSNLIHKSDRWIIDRVVDFNKLVEETNLMIIEHKVEAAANHYNKLLNLYDDLSKQVSDAQRVELYNKTKEIYDSINQINY